MFASVIINVSSSNVDQLYDYKVPQSMEDIIKVGTRVLVPFGQGDRLTMGYVLTVKDNCSYEGVIKEVKELLDFEPVFTFMQLKLAFYLHKDLVCPVIRILNLMLPKAMQLKTYKYARVINKLQIDAELMPLFSDSNAIIINDKLSPYINKINKEINKGNIEIAYEAKQSTNYKYINKYLVNDKYLNEHEKDLTSKQKFYLEKLSNNTFYTKNDLIDKYDFSTYLVDKLSGSFLSVSKEKVLRVKEHHILTKDLSYDFKENDLTNKFNDVTKPYLYIPMNNLELETSLIILIKRMINNNKNSVIICPEISTTLKIASVIRKALNIDVPVLNSNISDAEYLDYYNGILNNLYPVVVTSCKGCFLPYQNVGLYYMLDEESENYFNDQSPRYDMRRVIRYLSYYNKSLMILQSFVPSAISYTYGILSKYQIIDNYKGNKSPNVCGIDMLKELRKGNDSSISAMLKDCLLQSKQNNKQTLLVINNKNSSSYVECRECGYTIKCTKCNQSMQYNEKRNEIVCPECGYHIAFSSKCPKCLGTKFIYGSFGMEKVESDLKKELPDILTHTLSENTEEAINMANMLLYDHKIDCLITNETCLKAVYDEFIENVCIMNLDTFLKTPSFNAWERTYKVLTKCYTHLISKKGSLYVQTTDIYNEPLKYFVAGTYQDFMKMELEKRKLLRYEPFYEVNRIIIKSNYNTMFKDANSIKSALLKLLPSNSYILGPTYSKDYKGCVLIIKHNFKEINNIYMNIYLRYQGTETTVIFDKYPRNL